MYKKILTSLFALLLIFSASAFVWQTYSDTNLKSTNPQDNLLVSKVDLSWQQDSKSVDLDQYIASNQVSQNIIDKKQRVMLEPELIHFHGVLQAPITHSKAGLVTDALAVWGVSPLPEVAFSTYVRTPQGQVIAVYVENIIASHISTYYPVETVLEFQAYRLYNYAKGPRLLLVGVKPVNEAIAASLTASKNTLFEKSASDETNTIKASE